ncbi:hypothetical protein Ancab_005526 [Ancistrocladus abbreviatus]
MLLQHFPICLLVLAPCKSHTRYCDLNAYYRRQMEKEKKKGLKKVLQTEHTVFNDEEQRRLELQQEREKRKE